MYGVMMACVLVCVGGLYQGGREVMICTPWLKIGLDVGVINADGPF